MLFFLFFSRRELSSWECVSSSSSSSSAAACQHISIIISMSSAYQVARNLIFFCSSELKWVVYIYIFVNESKATYFCLSPSPLSSLSLSPSPSLSPSVSSFLLSTPTLTTQLPTLPRSSTKDKNPLLGSVSVLRVRENGKLKSLVRT